MIWLAMVSLAVGGLLAQHFKILVLAPATILVVLVAGVGAAHINGFWQAISTVATASVGIQVGYFLGMLLQYGLGTLPPRKRLSAAAEKRVENQPIARRRFLDEPG